MGKENFVEKKELLQPSHVIFFDMDDTLWEMQNDADDWLSKGATTDADRLIFTLDEETDTITRENDGIKIRLKDGVRETLTNLSEMGIPLGIVSDNRPQDVETVAKMFGIWKFFDQDLTHIKLYNDAVDGPCNKGLVIHDLLAGLRSRDAKPHVLFLDDKGKYREKPEFSEPLNHQGIQFIQSPKSTFPSHEVMRFTTQKL